MSRAHPKALGLVLLGAVSPAPCLACPQGWRTSGMVLGGSWGCAPEQALGGQRCAPHGGASQGTK